ncbi:transposase [Desulfosporosinus shakirovi]|uniref:transposase n=1 Tax=Desulfosporosinus shakirovi TaxID=2885154 RepID=UPI001E508EF9|nr:transposase [Desulfosporosinus sp. SRJS8]MCB8814625.1 transposase [Desulfosporosinus sp. SRJS8]
MPRSARQRSNSRIYHIMFRGNELRDIFIDDEDRNKFLSTFKEKSECEDFSVYAYCLMDNHVHFLLSGEHEKLGKLVKRINTSYVYYFNKKYERIGHLFHDRFKSQAVETDAYLLEAIRYIHNNPVKAGIARAPNDYKWSSYPHYIKDLNNTVLNIDKAAILKLFSHDPILAQKCFVEFSKEAKAIEFMDIEESETKKKSIIRGKIAAKQYTEEILNHNCIKLDSLRLKGFEDIRNQIILELRQKSDLSVREIASLLMINRGMVQRIRM